MYVEVDPFGADSWKLDPIVELLNEGAVGVIPTDTVYVDFFFFFFSSVEFCDFSLVLAFWGYHDS